MFSCFKLWVTQKFIRGIAFEYVAIHPDCVPCPGLTTICPPRQVTNFDGDRTFTSSFGVHVSLFVIQMEELVKDEC